MNHNITKTNAQPVRNHDFYHGSDRANQTSIHTSYETDSRTQHSMHEHRDHDNDSITNTFANLNLYDPPRASHTDSLTADKQNEASTTIDPNNGSNTSKASPEQHHKVPPSSMYGQSTPNGPPFVHTPYQYLPYGFPYLYYGMPPINPYPNPSNMENSKTKPVSMSEPISPNMYPHHQMYTFPQADTSIPFSVFPVPQQQPIIDHYRNVPYALNPKNPSPSYPVSSSGEFPNWINTLIEHLKVNNYDDLIPNKHGVIARTPSHWEQLGLQWLFSTFVKRDFLPPWVKEAQDASVPIFTILQRAMTLAIQDTVITLIMRKLRNLNYSGREPAFIFNANVQKIIQHIPTKDYIQYESLIKDALLSALLGPYTYIEKEFRTKHQQYSIQDVYNRIAAEYDYNSTEYSRSISVVPTCSYCHNKGHTITNCRIKGYHEESHDNRSTNRSSSRPTTRSTNRSTNRSTTRSYTSKPISKSKKTLNNITYTTDVENDHYWLRPNSIPVEEDKHFILDSGASATVVNSSSLLHNLDNTSQTPTISSSQSIPMDCTGKGTLKLKLYNKSIIDITAYVIPEVENNLLSTHALETNGIHVQSKRGTLENADCEVLAKYIKYQNLP